MPQNEPEAILDGQLDLKKRSRRRLVGAAALALLAIIVLPMVMDEEPKQPVQDLQIKIPSQDAAGLASRSLAAKPTPLSTPAEAAAVKPEKAPAPAAKADANPSAAPAQPTAAAKSVETPVVKPVDKAEKPVDKPAAAKAEATRAAAALNGVPTEEQWVVLLGAYKDPANVKQLTNKLKQMGLPSFSEHFDSPQGPRTRVRAGPFKARDAAEKAPARIKTIGVDGQVAQSK